MGHILRLTVMLGLIVAVQAKSNTYRPQFYAKEAFEYRVEFQHILKTDFTTLSQIHQLSAMERKILEARTLSEVLRYFMGPLAHRFLGGVRDYDELKLNFDAAWVDQDKSGFVMIPYRVRGRWVLRGRQDKIELPLPYRVADLRTPGWLRCGSDDPEYQGLEMLWYFWDPLREGCDHQDKREYGNVVVQLKLLPTLTTDTRPEYERLIRQGKSGPLLPMTLAFGYVHAPQMPDPETDMDQGAIEYRHFIAWVENNNDDLAKTPILAKEVESNLPPEQVVGWVFRGLRQGVNVELRVVMAAGLEQMRFFADSFARRHDSFFAWFGHSRLGEGFDARIFRILLFDPNQKLSITNNYQLVYWGGCNSYSYYTDPFFNLKAEYSKGQDPQGTKNLDLISNGLATYFNLNNLNAQTLVAAIFKSLFADQGPVGYRQIVDQMESHGEALARPIIVNVLGDGDNPRE